MYIYLYPYMLMLLQDIINHTKIKYIKKFPKLS